MDQKELLISCIETYSNLKNIPGNKVFQSFEKATILSMILDSHKTFPEMDTAFYMGMIDGITAMESDASENDYKEYQKRTALIIEVVGMLMKKHHLDGLEACRLYYESPTAEAVGEDHTDYFKKTPEEIFCLISKG